MIEPASSNKAARCARCGATIQHEHARCWLCGSRTADDDAPPDFDINPYAAPQAIEIEADAQFPWATMLIGITVIAVLGGLYTIWPGVSFALAIILAIPLLRTLLLVRARIVRGKATTWGQRVQLTGLSALFLLAAVAIFGVAAGAAFFCACWVALGTAAVIGDRHVLPVFFGVLGLMSIGALVGFGYLVRRRWRRDVGAE